jgi:hypothetical protein
MQIEAFHALQSTPTMILLYLSVLCCVCLLRYVLYRVVIGHAIIDFSQVSGLSVIGLFIAVALGVWLEVVKSSFLSPQRSLLESSTP